jgi:putative ABC transport system permease protein
VGDSVPIIGTIYPRVDGSEWRFVVRGIYRSTRPNVDEMTMYWHFEYLDEARTKGECLGPEGTSVYLVRVQPDARSEEVAARIDARYEGGPQRTRTETEAAFQAGFVSMLGNLPTFLGMIGGAVLVALLFGVVNTMTLAARERVRTTGILRALGFPPRVPARLYLLESLALVGLGGALGVGLSLWSAPLFRRMFGTQIPMYEVAPDTVAFAAIVCVGIALAAGAVPAWAALRLKAVEALRRGG